MAEELLRRDLGIQFASECRVDGLDLDLLRLLKEAGLRQVLLGIESGSERVLRRWRKGATVEQNRRAIETINKAGIALEPGFILFDAHTTAQELGESLGFLRSTGLDVSPMPTYLVNRLSVYPGTEIERLMRADGTLPHSPMKLWENGNDPAAVREYFQTLEYSCRDPRSEIAWRQLRREIEPVESFLEAKLPVLTNVLAQVRGPGVPAQTSQRARELIRAAGRWRRSVGHIVTRMIELVIESYDQPSNAHQIRWLRRELANAREQHALKTLGYSFDGFIETVADTRRASVTLDLSVVVPSAGKWSRLRQTLDALSRQTLPSHVRWEVVLVLDGIAAPDSAELTRLGLDLRIVSTPVKGGRGYARNRGIEAASAEIVVLLDDDMVPVPGFLQAHLAAQQRMSSVCHGPTRELPPLAYFSDLDRLAPDSALADRPGLERMRSWARRTLAKVASDPVTAFERLGTPSRLERDGIDAWSSGSLAGAVVAFAGANLSAPRRWLLRCPFDERPGTRWGLEDLALVLRLLLKGHPIAVAESARALHLSHHRAGWREQQRANIACLDVLPDTVGQTILSYLEGDAPLDALELALQPHLEVARRRALFSLSVAPTTTSMPA
jgi:GT2 family glycosyltransferase